MRTNEWKIPSIDYTSRDYRSLRDDMIRTIPYYTPEWTDYNPSDFGIVLLELMAFMGDNLHYYIDRMAAESFLPTAITRKSVVNLLKLIDYNITGRTASTTVVKFTIDDGPLDGDLYIPKNTLLQTICDRQGSQEGNLSNAIYFETDELLTIPSGYIEGSVSATQGITVYDQPLGYSNGMPSQIFEIPDNPVVEGTLQVFVDEGRGLESWDVVDSLIVKDACDKAVEPSVDENNSITLQFGDNTNGKIPESTSGIYATYKVGGGSVGNVGIGAITTVSNTITFNGAPVAVSVTNITAATGGSNEQSIDSAKLNGPRSLRAMYRAVTLEDYETWALTVPGVFQVEGRVDKWRNCNRLSMLPVSIFAVPNISGNVAVSPDTQLKEDIINLIDSYKMVGTTVEVFDPIFQPINLSGSIYYKEGRDKTEVSLLVTRSINEYFSLTGSPYVGFAQDIYLSDIISVLDGVDGVDHVNIDVFTKKPIPKWMYKTGNVGFNVDSFEIGSESLDEEWRITFIDSTTFTVRGTKSGVQDELGEVGITYVVPDKLSFLLEYPSERIDMSRQDAVVFTTGTNVGNIVLDSGEYAIKGDVFFNYFSMASLSGINSL